MSLISKRAQVFQSSGIRKVFNLAANLKNPVNFSIGQPDFGPSEQVKQKIFEAVQKNISGYTQSQGILPLREKIVEKLKKENNIMADTDTVFVTPGSSAGIFLALCSIIDEGDEVIFPDPYFVEYPELVKFLGAKVVLLDTYPTFQIDVEKLSSLITDKTKAIILNSPNNPTGAVYPENTLREIAKIAEEKNIVIISDEIYEYFVYEDAKHFSIGSIYPNTVTVNGLSKSGGMPGWRLCYSTGPKEIIQKMIEISQYTFVCAPSLVQYGAIEAIGQKPRDKIAQYQKRRDIILDTLGKKYEIIKPDGAFYIMPKVKDGEKFTKWAIENNVLVIPGNVFSQKDTHIRISYAISNESIQQGIQILLKYPY